MLDYTIYIIALVLSIDCFVVAITLSSGLKLSKKLKYLVPVHFGIFHVGMILLGFFLGVNLIKVIQGFDHWIAFALLCLVGIKMSLESFKKEKTLPKNLSYPYILILAIATSIDAIAVGVSLIILQGNIFINAIIIGIFALVSTTIGLIIGNRIKKYNFRYLALIGGLVLIGLGIKILIEHLI